MGSSGGGRVGGGSGSTGSSSGGGGSSKVGGGSTRGGSTKCPSRSIDLAAEDRGFSTSSSFSTRRSFDTLELEQYA